MTPALSWICCSPSVGSAVQTPPSSQLDALDARSHCPSFQEPQTQGRCLTGGAGQPPKNLLPGCGWRVCTRSSRVAIFRSCSIRHRVSTGPVVPRALPRWETPELCLRWMLGNSKPRPPFGTATSPGPQITLAVPLRWGEARPTPEDPRISGCRALLSSLLCHPVQGLLGPAQLRGRTPSLSAQVTGT